MDADSDGSADENLRDFANAELGMDRVVFLNYSQYSQSARIDTVFFDLCSADYVINLEDDWESRITTWFQGNILGFGLDPDLILDRVLSNAIRLLEENEEMLEVWVGDTPLLQKYSNVSSWIQMERPDENGPQWYRHRYAFKDSAIGVTRPGNSIKGDTSHKTGGSLKHRGRLARVGRMSLIHDMLGLLKDPKTDWDVESLYAAKAEALGFSSGQFCLSKKGPRQGGMMGSWCSVDPEKIGSGSTTGIFWKTSLV